MYAIKAEINDPMAEEFAFYAQKTMYGGRHIACSDTIFIFAVENQGGSGLLASGVVTFVEAVAKASGVARQTPPGRRGDLQSRARAWSPLHSTSGIFEVPLRG